MPRKTITITYAAVPRSVVFVRLASAGRAVSVVRPERTNVITCRIEFVMKRMAWSRPVAAKWLYDNATVDAGQWTVCR